MGPSDVLARLIAIFPEFRPHWNSTENHFREDDGSFTSFGVFADFSHFIRERFTSLTPDQLGDLGKFVEECMRDESSDLDTAVATCFLENVTSEDFTSALAAHFGVRANAFLSQY